MKDSLVPGLTHRLEFTVPVTKTVPYIYPESPEISSMPEVFATGFMVGLMEWACIELLTPHLDEGEGSLGVHVNVSHSGATLPGMTVSVDVECLEVKSRRAKFSVKAHDGVEVIGQGEHERFIVEWDRFNRRLAQKADAAGVSI